MGNTGGHWAESIVVQVTSMGNSTSGSSPTTCFSTVNSAHHTCGSSRVLTGTLSLPNGSAAHSTRPSVGGGSKVTVIVAVRAAGSMTVASSLTHVTVSFEEHVIIKALAVVQPIEDLMPPDWTTVTAHD